jgi:dipeptidyl aminopeptidase/acylaminoacyl peptidase
MTKTLRPVEQADLFRFKFLQSGVLSPDGKRAAYVVSHSDPEEEKDYSAIWLVDLNSGDSRQLTSGTAVDANPRWSLDGKYIAFMSTREEKPQLYVIPVDGGEARQLTKFKQGIGGGPAWSPDGKHIAFTAVPIEEPRDPAKPYRVTRNVYRFNGMEYLDDVVQSLYVIPLEGGEARQVTKDKLMNANPQWSPDGKSLMYLANMKPEIHNVFFPRIRIVNLLDDTIHEIAGEWGFAYAAAWLPDGESITFIGAPFGKPIGSKVDLWVVSAKNGKSMPECRTEKLKYGVAGGLQADMPVMSILTTIPTSKDGKAAYVPVQIGGTVQIYRVALAGKETHDAVLSGDRACLLLDADERHILYSVSGFNSPTELYVSDIEGGKERALTHLNDDLLAQLNLPKVEHLLFPGSDGAQVEGWAIVPDTGHAPYPTILYIHGGPHGAFGHTYHFDTQMLCGAGYAVLMVNHRASTGYGDEFSTAIKGDWGNLDYKDLMAGVDYAIAKGIADPDRLGVCGLSGGGNLTCWTVGQTDRFKAAAPENPVTNWVSFYGVSDIGVWFAVEELGGHPHEIPEIYAKCSPITYAHRCKTPTLLMQGEHDWRCPPEQSEQFYSVLKANGCTAEMLRFPKANHAASIVGSISVRSAHNEALLDWMNRYVLGKNGEKN